MIKFEITLLSNDKPENGNKTKIKEQQANEKITASGKLNDNKLSLLLKLIQIMKAIIIDNKAT